MEIINELPEVFEDFGEARKNSFLGVKKIKEQGIPVVGVYCTYMPREIVMAAGAATVGLCSTSDETIPDAEKDLPKNLCPLIKSSYGFAKTDKCPFFYFSDVVVGETTCDGKKKMYEIMSEIKDVFMLQLPQIQDEAGVQAYRKELIRFKEYLEQKFETKITDEKLLEAIQVNNNISRAMQKVADVMIHDPAPITGHNLFKLFYGSGFKFDRTLIADELNSIADKIEAEYAEGKMLEKRPRILITGCPIGGATEKVIKAIEENGGVVVGYENCTGAKQYDMLVDETKEDLYEALAERYLAIGCSVMSPNKNRYDLLGRMIDRYQVDGVVEMTLQTCLTYQIESRAVRNYVTNEKNVPYLAVETDYSQTDIEQLNTRITAFLEML
ncbi:MAG: 2-hydroxyacyl-CoA dehydratase family protein [Dorea sp.]|nr:2-hydroxyacyl-CoA dehydratase family protein [Dorea sp.]